MNDTNHSVNAMNNNSDVSTAETSASHSTDNPTQSTSSRFAHLSQMARVVSGPDAKSLWGLGLGVLCIAGLIIFMLSGSTHAKPVNEESMSVDDNSNVIAQNTARLNQPQAPAQIIAAPLPLPLTAAVAVPNNSALLARQNAPTQMYALTDNGAVGAASATSQENTTTNANAVLADSGNFAQFANNQGASVSTVTATHLLHPDYTVAEGEFIQATLETAIDSDLPGMVRAVITSPVYAYTGEAPLIPAGSRLIGQYTSMPSNGLATTRVFVVWNRILTPDGISILINSPATDALGEAGAGANMVDVHFWQMFGTAALLSVMSATSATAGVSQFQQPNSANMYQQSISSAFQQSAQNSLGQNLTINPTLHVYQGDSINVFVAHDVDLYSVLANSNNNGNDDDSSSGLIINNGYSK